MIRAALIFVASAYSAFGAFIFVAPMSFYKYIPGIEALGPFSIHFIRDAGLAYLASGAIMVWGTLNRQRAVIVAGGLWPCLHALFHFQMWIARGFPADLVALINLVGIQVPAWLGLYLAFNLSKRT